MAVINVSEDTATRLKAAAVGHGMDPEELLLELLNRIEEEEAMLLAAPLSEEDIAAIQDGIAQIEAGKTIPWETLAEERKAAREARRKAREGVSHEGSAA